MLVPPLQGLGILWTVTQGVARGLALPWAIIYRAFSPFKQCKGPFIPQIQSVV